MRVVVGLAVLVLALLIAAPAQAFPVMSCASGEGQDWFEHPSTCTYGAVHLRSLKWRHWGRETATATGRRTTGHGGRPRYRTTVQVRRLTRCGDTATFYREIRFKTRWPGREPRYSQWRPLTVPCN